MKNRKAFFEISQQLIGHDYQLGTVDCFSIVLQYMRILGRTVPTEYKGQTEQSYPELYLRNKSKAQKIMISFIDDHFEPVTRPRCGDIMLLKSRKGNEPESLGIHGGNATVISASVELGTSIFGLSKYRIIKAWSAN